MLNLEAWMQLREQEPETFVLSGVKHNLSAQSPSLSYRTVEAEKKPSSWNGWANVPTTRKN